MPYLATGTYFGNSSLLFTACVPIDVIFILCNISYSSFRLRPLNDNFFFLFLLLFIFIKELVLFITAQTIIYLSLMQSLPLLLFLLKHKALYIGLFSRFLSFFFDIRIPFNSLRVELGIRIILSLMVEAF
jgi:hypothetical protein